jgi:hypothetical protein
MVHIVGADHEHQRLAPQSEGPEDFLQIERDQKIHFRALLEHYLGNAGNGDSLNCAIFARWSMFLKSVN